ncbi:hypothetical protein M0R45_012033 [Rubus argutus]|uniref:Uncharacterized protein n=1 Tax=Rubus argutus TaxID=59490 RepID=A0AAW1YBJ5_RUBAR
MALTSIATLTPLTSNQNHEAYTTTSPLPCSQTTTSIQFPSTTQNHHRASILTQFLLAVAMPLPPLPNSTIF